LWKDLIKEWQLSSAEAELIDLQQGMKCKSCHTHMRGNVLALAILKCLNSSSLSLAQLINEEKSLVSNIRILEINEAGNLGSYLSHFSHHQRINYPEFNMHDLSSFSARFDLVIHSDTLEHISNPVHALSECKSVLAEDGFLIYTIPVIPGRMTRNRHGLASSTHSRDSRTDYRVETEFGADFWCFPLQAGFQNISIITISYPIALAIAAQK